jgi:multiple sugar transport system permease protein
MTTLSVAKPRARPLISWRVRKLLIGYSYLVPAALCMLATVVVPIILAIKMSLYADVLYKPADYRFIGLGNYIRLVQDPVFWLTLWNSVVWVFGSVILQFVFGFAAALLLQQAFRGRALVRTLTLLPWIIPGVVVGLIWQWLYQPNYGVINDLLIRVGWMHERLAWLSSPDTAMAAVVFANVWRGIPFFAIMLLAGLTAVGAGRALRSGPCRWRRRAGPFLAHHLAVAAAHHRGRHRDADHLDLQLCRPDFRHDRRRPGQRHPDHVDLHLAAGLFEP